jgi:PAS domain S-box-containing protein
MKIAPSRTDRRAALRIVAIYAVFATTWIYLSDTALTLLVSDLATLFQLAVLKGLLFITCTGPLLYQLIVRHFYKSRLLEEDLRKNQSLVNSLIEGTTDAIFVKDREGRYLLFNTAAAAITGKAPAEVKGNDDTFLFSAEEAAKIMAGDRQVMTAGRVMTYEDYLTASDGTYRTFLATKGPIFDNTGELIGLFGVSRDITDRERAREALLESEKQYRSLFENMLEGYAYCRMLSDDDGCPSDFIYLAVNNAFEQLTGLRDVVGKKVTEVIPEIKELTPELIDIYGRVASTGQSEKFELYLRPLQRWFSISVYSPQPGHFVAMFDNISERKRMDAAQQATIELLRICNGAGDMRTMMRDLTWYFEQVTGCEAVGVRLRQGEDFPYYETRGFPEQFVLAENSLCAIDQSGEIVRDTVGHPTYDCMCGNIICRRFDSMLSFFTANGSFWTSSTTELLASTTDADRQTKTRNRCNGEGYESVALIPLRMGVEVFGLFQFNDRRRDLFTAEKIAQLEDLVAYVSIALAKQLVDEELEESSRFSQQIINSVAEGVIVLNRELRFQIWNPYMEQLSGFPASNICGKHLLSVFPDFGKLGIVERYQATLAGRKPTTSDFPYTFPGTGRSGWISEMNAPLRNTKNEIVGVIVTVRDITEREQAAEVLQEVTQRLRLATAAGHLGIWDRDIRTDELVWDERMYEIYGIAKDSFAGCFTAWQNRLHQDDVSGAVEAIRAAVSGEREYDTEFRIVLPDGTIKNVKANGIVIRDADGNGIRMIGLNQDITDRKHIEEQLRQAQKMEAIGQLAGGIAHDFNNILTAIYGYCYLLQTKMNQDSPYLASVDQILAAAERAANLTKGLLAFSRKQTMNPALVDLNDLILMVGKLLTRIIGEDIHLKTAFSADPVTIFADSGQIEQVLMNLAANARDAMPTGGLLTIETDLQNLTQDFIAAHGFGTCGRYVVMSVSDTGEGMDVETCNKIFEPFFTTKEVGKGTGLGLSIVYGVIKQHHGYITVCSEPGRGTTFRIYLPISTAEQADHEEPATFDYPRRGSETVLVAEDDASVRQITETILRKFGYEVVFANDGIDAVEKFKKNLETIALVVMDMVMPGKSGKEAYAEIKKLRPDVKVIFMSGYSPELLHNKKILDTTAEILVKPVPPLELARKVRAVLDA